MKKHKVILNPTAGSGAGARSIHQIENTLRVQALDFDIVQSEYPGHAIKLAEQAALSGYEVVVAAGGDGTSNEVINGLQEAKAEGMHDCALGILSVGRGNDFAHTVNVPIDLELAARVLAEGHRRRIDIGRVYGGLFPQGRYFGNCVGVGFDAIGTIEAAKLPRWGGFFSFLVAVLKTIFLYHEAPVSTVTYDGHSLTQPSLMISIMNGRRLGGGFWMAPQAEADDGLFDLCIAHQVSRRRIFGLIPHFLRGSQSTQPEITTGKAAKITIAAIEGALPAQTDGEILCIDGQRLEIELLPHELDVICMFKGSGT
ncbi:MAG: YegS/Rv2252/BmrU family lipid kinase [Anaerolineales bacterium]|nr:YegS/Rv2252/BmrU family lipid kinase [Anaerolineales bacterium]